jgi:hypothetical protein
MELAAAGADASVWQGTEQIVSDLLGRNTRAASGNRRAIPLVEQDHKLMDGG